MQCTGKIKCNTIAGFAQISFKYEKVPQFCFLCGLIDHNDRFFKKQLEANNGTLICEWGLELRALTRRQRELRIGERWLRSNPLEEEEASGGEGGAEPAKDPTKLGDKLHYGNKSLSFRR